MELHLLLHSVGGCDEVERGCTELDLGGSKSMEPHTLYYRVELMHSQDIVCISHVARLSFECNMFVMRGAKNGSKTCACAIECNMII